MTVEYPDDTAGEFPGPPRTVTDDEGREIRYREGRPDDDEALVEMYLDFHPEDRAQGIPPGREPDIRTWLENVTADECRTVVAMHEGDVIGHGMLVPDQEGDFELALFVLRAYQGAGIGTELLRTLLGLGRATGVEQVWLSVERWNDPAMAVYRKVGFERVGEGSFELEMALRL
jgi:GNAT superfamily N-acetyltransferase